MEVASTDPDDCGSHTTDFDVEPCCPSAIFETPVIARQCDSSGLRQVTVTAEVNAAPGGSTEALLVVDGAELVVGSGSSGFTLSGPVDLAAGEHQVRVEFPGREECEPVASEFTVPVCPPVTPPPPPPTPLCVALKLLAQLFLIGAMIAFVVAACVVQIFPNAAPWVAGGAAVALVIGIVLVFAWILLCSPGACSVGNLFRRVFYLSALVGSWIVWLCPPISIPLLGAMLLLAALLEYFLARRDCAIEPVCEL
ncbi:MAG: hypothetical protein AAF628_35280 [Planctomycetota bacterium]